MLGTLWLRNEVLWLINLKTVSAPKGPKLTFKCHVFQGNLAFFSSLVTYLPQAWVGDKEIEVCKWCGSFEGQNCHLDFALKQKQPFKSWEAWADWQGSIGSSRCEESPPAQDFCRVQKSYWSLSCTWLQTNASPSTHPSTLQNQNLKGKEVKTLFKPKYFKEICCLPSYFTEYTEDWHLGVARQRFGYIGEGTQITYAF